MLPIPTPVLSELLATHYGLDVSRVTPLLSGYGNAGAAQIQIRSGELFFLKLKRDVSPPALAVASLLSKLSLPVVAPVPSLAHQLSVHAGALHVLLYPFLAAEPIDYADLSSAQWKRLGASLRSIHETSLPEALFAVLPRQSFTPFGEQFLANYDDALVTAPTGTARAAREALWRTHQPMLLHFLRHTEQLGHEAAAAAPSFHLCHNDFHSGNVLLDPGTGELTLVDWDNPALAPRERDLLFVGPKYRPLFAQGYGPYRACPAAARYAEADWLLQDFLDCLDRLVSPELTPREQVWATEMIQAIAPPMQALLKDRPVHMP